jgi:hypothetical protein
MYAMMTPFSMGGKPLAWNPDLPFQDLQMLGDPGEAFGMLSPFLKAPIELLGNKNFFFDRPIKENAFSKVQAPTYLRWMNSIPGLRDLMGMERITAPSGEGTTVGMDPRASYMFQQIPFLTNLSKWTDFNAPLEKHVTDVMSSGAGIKLFPYDVEGEKEKVGWQNVDTFQAYMNNLARQHGTAVPSMDTLQQFLRYLNEAPVLGEKTAGTQYPDKSYYEYLLAQTGMQPPFDPAMVAEFKRAYEAGEIEVPEALKPKTPAIFSAPSKKKKKKKAGLAAFGG